MSEQFPGWLVYVSAIAYALAFKKTETLECTAIKHDSGRSMKQVQQGLFLELFKIFASEEHVTSN